MTKQPSNFNKRTYILFLAISSIICYVVFEILSNWIRIFAGIYGKPNLGYHDLPLHIHGIQEAIRWMVWVGLAITIAVDVRKREFTKTAGYISGIIVAAVVIVVVIMYRFGAAMEGF